MGFVIFLFWILLAVICGSLGRERNIGGTGAGFSITVSSLVAGTVRPVYDANNSVQPLWNNDDISTIVDLALQDATIAGAELGSL